MVLRHLLRVLGSDPKHPRNLSSEEAMRAFASILAGGESDVTIASFLMALRWKGATFQELTGFAQAARAQARMPCSGMPGLVTLCPSHDGQDHHPPLEVAAGLVTAAAGARVLIISDRCVPPRRGLTAANALEAIGLSMTWDPLEAEDWVAKGGFAVISISGMLPSMLTLRRVRGEMVVRTPLATVEKLLAPPGSAVVLGAQEGPVLGVAVEVIQALGHPRGVALQGIDGGVIPSVCRRTRGIELAGESLAPLPVEPADFGLEGSEEADLPLFSPPEEGYGSADNPSLVQSVGEVTLSVLRGDLGPARDATLLGAAVALKASGRCPTLAEGVDAAASAIDSGAALERLELLRTLIT